MTGCQKEPKTQTKQKKTTSPKKCSAVNRILCNDLFGSDLDMVRHSGRTVSSSGPSLLNFLLSFPYTHSSAIQKKAMCALCIGNCTFLWYYMSCLTNIHSWSINVKLLLSWQFSQAPQRYGHLLYVVLRCWFMRRHLLNIPCPILAVCSVTEKGRREGCAFPTQSLCQNAHYRYLPRNLRS